MSSATKDIQEQKTQSVDIDKYKTKRQGIEPYLTLSGLKYTQRGRRQPLGFRCKRKRLAHLAIRIGLPCRVFVRISVMLHSLIIGVDFPN